MEKKGQREARNLQVGKGGCRRKFHQKSIKKMIPQSECIVLFPDSEKKKTKTNSCRREQLLKIGMQC